MKAIEVKKGDKVLYIGEESIVIEPRLNDVLIELSDGSTRAVSYSQIKKYEPEQIDMEKQGS